MDSVYVLVNYELEICPKFTYIHALWASVKLHTFSLVKIRVEFFLVLLYHGLRPFCKAKCKSLHMWPAKFQTCPHVYTVYTIIFTFLD